MNKKIVSVMIAAVMGIGIILPVSVLAAPVLGMESPGNTVWYENSELEDFLESRMDSSLTVMEVPSLSSEESEAEAEGEEEPSYVPQMAAMAAAAAVDTKSYGQTDYGVSVYGNGTRGFIARAYAVIHGRTAGSSEIDYWANLLDKGNLSALGFIKSVLESPEFTKRNLSNEEYITVMCQVMQNKDPNENDMAYHKKHITKGYSRLRLTEFIEDSYEFIWLCEAYGMKQQAATNNGNNNSSSGSSTLPGAGSYGQSDYGVSVYGSGIRGFVARVYAVVHGRAAGSSEIDYWANLLNNGSTNGLGFIKSVFQSPEVTNRNLSNEDFITVMCRVMQNKDPNANDMAYHKGHISKGYSRNRLMESIEDSYEFGWLLEAYGMKQKATTNNGDNNSSSGSSTLPGAGSYGQSDYGVSVYGSGTRGFVARVYAVVHGRAAGSSEIDYWANLLNNGSTNGLGFIKSVFQSPEVTNRNLSNEDFITVMCRVMQNKDPNANDMAYHKGHISKGYSRNRLMESIEDSYEFGWLLQAYGLKNAAAPNESVNVSEKGVDVSAHQGSINWTAVKNAGYDFAIIRATTYSNKTPVVDPYFYQNVRGAKAAGLKVGVYIFTYSYSSSGVLAEINTAVNAMQAMEREGYRFDYPVFWDIEANDYTNAIGGVEKTTDLVIYALDTIRSKGYYSALYTYTNFANTRLNMSRLWKYDFWVAQYGSRVTYGGAYTAWQYTSTGSVPGISGNVDLSYNYKDYSVIIKRDKWNKW